MKYPRVRIPCQRKKKKKNEHGIQQINLVSTISDLLLLGEN